MVSSLATSPSVSESAASERERGTGTLLLGIGLLWAEFRSRQPTVAKTPFDVVWFDFRDSFGIVWGKRLQERVNEFAQRERWSAHLGQDGFQWEEHEPALEKLVSQAGTEARIDHTLRWLLRRFVEPVWLDERMKAGSGGVGE